MEPDAKSGSLKRVVRRLRRLAKEWPADYLLVAMISDGAGITLYDRHPEDGGRPVERFAIRSDAIDGEPPNAPDSATGRKDGSLQSDG